MAMLSVAASRLLHCDKDGRCDGCSILLLRYSDCELAVKMVVGMVVTPLRSILSFQKDF